MSKFLSPTRAFLIVSLLLTSHTVCSQWEYVGGPDNYFIPDGSSSLRQILEFHPETAEPYVFFTEHVINSEIGPSLIKYNGTEWEYISMQFDANGSVDSELFGFYFRSGTNIPVVAYENYFWNPDAGVMMNSFKVAERIGSEWYDVIGIDNLPFDDFYFGCNAMSMVPNPLNTDPVLIGNSENVGPSGSSTLVTYLNNEVWEYMGDDDFGALRGNYYDIDYNTTTNQPYVATTGSFADEDPMIMEVFVFNGDWQSLGNPGIFPVPLDDWKIRVSPVNGDVYVMATEHYDNPDNAQVRTLRISKWDGSTWEILGQPEEIYLNSALGYDIEIHPETGVPYVCFRDGNHPNNLGGINIRIWDGSNWVNLDENNPTFSVGDGIDMEFQPGTNYPYVTSGAGHLLRYVPTASSNSELSLVDIQVYPNPASDLITFSEMVEGAELFDINGKKVMDAKRTNQMSMGQLSDGMYLLKLTTTSGNVLSKEVVKQ